jgi:hypothetical protein
LSIISLNEEKSFILGTIIYNKRMRKIYIGLVLLLSSLGYAQQLSEVEKRMSELAGTWKTEVEGSALTLVISLQVNEEKEHFQISLININGEKFLVNESTITSPAQSEYKVNVIKAAFEQYEDCIIKDAIINLKRLNDHTISFSYHSEASDCSFGSDTGLKIPDIEGLIFIKEK